LVCYSAGAKSLDKKALTIRFNVFNRRFDH
jgi:hypothetical protein